MLKNNYYAYQKLVISGNILELYDYEYPIVKGLSLKKVGRANETMTDETTKQENRKKTQYRAKRQVARLINANSFEMKKFITLTFADNITDIKTANREFKIFIQRLNYYLKKHNHSNLKYVAVIEFQKRGAIHYHFLCNAPYIENKVLKELWKNGFVRINKIDNVDNVGAYVTKYMSKDLNDKRLQGKKCYLTSKHLEKPIETIDKEIIDELLPSIEIKREYKRNYTTEYNGDVVYTQYVLKHPVKALFKALHEKRVKENRKTHCELVPKIPSFRKPFTKRLISLQTNFE